MLRNRLLAALGAAVAIATLATCTRAAQAPWQIPSNDLFSPGVLGEPPPTADVRFSLASTVSLGGAWSPLAITGRSGHAAVVDPRRHRMIVFGGRDALGCRSDVWELSLETPPQWQRLSPSGIAPPPMENMSVALDSRRDRLLFFGGRDSVAGDPSGGSHYSALWALELDGRTRWIELRPAGPKPDARSGHVAIYDAVGDQMVMFGGVHAPHRHDARSSTPQYLHDAWSLQLAGKPHWRRLAPAGAAPAQSARGSAFFDPMTGRMIYTTDGDTLFALTLRSHPVWSARPTRMWPAFGLSGTHFAFDASRGLLYRTRDLGMLRVSLTGDPVWTLVAERPPWYGQEPWGTPNFLDDYTLVFDPAANATIMFGGMASNLATPWFEAAELSVGAVPKWTLLTGPRPKALAWPRLIFDPHRSSLIVLGAAYEGMSVASLERGPTPRWREITAGNQPQGKDRYLEGLVLDTRRDRLIMFGGLRPTANFEPYPIGDVWAFDLDNLRWSPIEANGPTARGNPVAFYDSLGDRMMVIGGYGRYSASGGDTLWSLTLGESPRWSYTLISGPCPPATLGSLAAFDSKRARILATSGYPQQHLWALGLHGALEWSDLGATEFPTSRSAAMAYDPAGDRLVSVISLAAPTSPGGLELWQRDLGTGVESRSIAPVDADWPENRTEFGLGYDPITNRFVLQGGFVVRREPQYSWSWPSDTWFLSMNPPRCLAAMGIGLNGDATARKDSAAADHGWNAAAEPKLAIERATFDRASRTVHVTLALARSSEARLVLYDLAGRRLASTRVRSDEPRLAVLPIGPAGPGVYFVQARQDDRAINARVIVTQ